MDTVFHPCRYYRGRGAFESMGAGIDMKAGDIAFKSNFATLNTSSRIVERRRADRIFEDLGPILCESLDGKSTPLLLSPMLFISLTIHTWRHARDFQLASFQTLPFSRVLSCPRTCIACIWFASGLVQHSNHVRSAINLLNKLRPVRPAGWLHTLLSPCFLLTCSACGTAHSALPFSHFKNSRKLTAALPQQQHTR